MYQEMLSQYSPTSAYTDTYNGIIGSKNKPVIFEFRLMTKCTKGLRNSPLVDGIDGISRDLEISPS